MKTLLVIPRYEYGECYVLPMGILYVASALKRRGHDVVTLNLNHLINPYVALVRKIGDEGIGFVGTGGLSGEYQVLKKLFETVKRASPEVTTFCGGGIITAEPSVAMIALEYVDIGIIGEGDETVPDLIDCLSEGGALEEIRGIIYKEESGELKITGKREEILDLDKLPLPDYDGFEYARYLGENDAGFGWKGERLSPVSVIGSRSCPYACTFCFHPTGVRYRTRSLDHVFAEIDLLVDRYHVNHIALREELFSMDRARTLAFCEGMKKRRGLYWSIQLRINQVDDDVLCALVAARCFAVFVGIESVDDNVLHSMNKKINHEQIEAVVGTGRRLGLLIRSGLIFGDKAETIESARKSLEWVRRNEGYNAILRRPAITAAMLVPFLGSELYRYACKKGIIEDRVEYLRKGCPIVNLTEKSESDFLHMMQEVQAYNRRIYNFMSGGVVRTIRPLPHDV